MVRVLVVDDEAFLRRSIKNTIEQVDQRFQVVAEVGDGLRALEIIDQINPDVVFMDIRMPILDGIGLLKKLDEYKNKPICVMLSGYSDFEYARNALRYHAYDYLLKPIDKEVLKQLLEKIYEKVIEEEYQKRHKLFEKVISAKRFEYTVEEINEILYDNKYFYAFYICEGSYLPNAYRHLPPIVEQGAFDHILQKIKMLCLPEEEIHVFHGNYLSEYFFLSSSKEKIDPKRILLMLFQNIKNSKKKITMVYGENCANLYELRESVIEIKYAHMLNTIFASSGMWNSKYISECTEESMGFSQKFQKELIKLCEEKHYENLYGHVTSLLLRCEDKKCTQTVLLDILKRICELVNGNRRNRMYEEQVEELFYVLDDYQELSRQLKKILAEIIQDNTSEAAGKNSVIEEIHEYIDIHFTDFLTLKNISDRFHVSAAYLSSIFKKEYGISPIEYIIEKRIKVSKILMQQNTNMTIKEIAEKVGYSDAYYFSRLFKSYVGESPSQFRKKDKMYKIVQ